MSYITIQFPGKSSGGSLSVFSGHSFASNWLLNLLDSGEEGIFFQRKKVTNARVGLGTLAYVTQQAHYLPSYCARSARIVINFHVTIIMKYQVLCNIDKQVKYQDLPCSQ